MYIKIRDISAKPDENDLIIDVSITAKIEEIKKIIVKEKGVDIDKQRLLYKGKQLENDVSVYEYNVKLNDVIQLMIKEYLNDSTTEDIKNDSSTSKSVKPVCRDNVESKYYNIGDFVDAHDPEYSAWFEGKVTEILESIEDTKDELNLENCSFIIKLEKWNHFSTLEVEFRDIRPRSYYTYGKSELLENMKVLVNYNIHEPDQRGFWYNCVITKISRSEVRGTVLVGRDQAPLTDCIIKFSKEIMRIEEPVLLSKRINSIPKTPLRSYACRCESCKDTRPKCNECGCRICGIKEGSDSMLLCDECDYSHHIRCLSPPLENIPEGEWFCPECKLDDSEIVKPGEKLKFSKKKAKMKSYQNDGSSRDWGRGMACVGRTKECTIVPKTHYGPVPGVDVGTCWMYRLQASEAGVHRPHVAGIHGRENDGAYSLVLSGGYEDDVDKGNEFYYTGSGGRDLSGNKRISEQSCDQKLTRMNKALAMNCFATFNDEEGAESIDWKKGKPVRVVRNYKLAKHSKYAPKIGNRYDGIYKVVKYYPEKGKSGYTVWRYLLRRDDPEPAPWSRKGKELEMLYPSEEDKKKAEEKEEITNKKRKIDDKSNGIVNSKSPTKKIKKEPYKLDSKLKNLIKNDDQNNKFWNECQEVLQDGKQKFFDKIQELFMCICCQDLLYLPITTECKHNICQGCLKRSFAAEIYTCPYCRFDLGKNYKIIVNEALSSALKVIFPGYSCNR